MAPVVVDNLSAEKGSGTWATMICAAVRFLTAQTTVLGAPHAKLYFKAREKDMRRALGMQKWPIDFVDALCACSSETFDATPPLVSVKVMESSMASLIP